ncbi:MAG: hypothetical protein IPK94_08365 [Saprospiraceae bacterium]|nr:hypothetical protein [Saprospiraceae bacterium]
MAMNQSMIVRANLMGGSGYFQTMAKENAAFMLWTGDAWYSREVDYYSKWGLWYRAQYARKIRKFNLSKSMPQWALCGMIMIMDQTTSVPILSSKTKPERSSLSYFMQSFLWRKWSKARPHQ